MRGPRGDVASGVAADTFHRPVWFWLGTVAITAGVLLHLPDYVAAGEMGYHMADMPMRAPMLAGMAAIMVGFGLAAAGLVAPSDLRRPSVRVGSRMRLHALDDAPFSRTHWGLVVVLWLALVIDVMKPATIGFVMPGMKAEYGLTTGDVALFPVFALTGTTLGSFVWGVLADRIGRRPTILLASLMFIGTSICGFMPSFAWNLFMCFFMGVAAGGMLPIVYALMAESIPSGKRGWVIVLHGGLGTAGGYLAASGLAALLEPHFAWRILWFAGLPTGLLLIVLNRWIPESPRFLLEHGRNEEAERVMARYGVVLDETSGAEPRVAGEPEEEEASHRALGPGHAAEQPTATPRLLRLFRRPYLGQTLAIASYGLAWGLANWGFLTFIPAILQDRGIGTEAASRILFGSALLAVPGTLVVAWLYGTWSSRKSMVLFACFTAVALLGFAVVDPGSGGAEGPWLLPLTVLLLISSGGVISMLSPYTAEVFPTALRGTGSGLAAGFSKLGGIVGPPAVAGLASVAAGFGLVATVTAVPMLASAALVALYGIETGSRPLEEVSEVATSRAK